jgi:hypothetical protein
MRPFAQSAYNEGRDDDDDDDDDDAVLPAHLYV